MGNRKAIQIALGDGGKLFALCSDGTIWTKTGSGDEWVQYSEGMPQDAQVEAIPTGQTLG